MKLIIHTPINSFDKEVKNPRFVPRKGERIQLYRNYAPIVTDVMHDYSDKYTVHIWVE